MECPHCGFKDIEYGSIYPQDEIIVQDAKCKNCGEDLPLYSAVDWQILHHESYPFMIMMSSNYVRDVQISYDNHAECSDEDGWDDCEGDIMLAKLYAPSKEAAIEKYKSQMKEIKIRTHASDIEIDNVATCDHIYAVQIIVE